MQKEPLDNYYKPAEDTLFFADFLENQKGRSALDIGTGSGLLAQVLAKNFALVVATDINILALKKAHQTVEHCICCNAADAFHTNFDLVVCNMPYLPSEKLSDPAVDGLHDGTEIPEIIIRSASKIIGSGGKVIFLTSSLAKYEKLIDLAKSLGFMAQIAKRKKLFFEELILVECIKKHSS